MDVVAAQSHVLSRVLSESTDFEKIQTAHAKFLAAVSRQCFLHVRTVRNAMDAVLRTCTDLCAIVEQSADDLHLKLPTEEIERIDRDYTRHSAYLFFLLAGISPKLRTRLDFNGYMTREASKFGSLGVNPGP